jgi:hypothetical protein
MADPDLGGLTLSGLLKALDDLDPGEVGAVPNWPVITDWPVVAHNPGTQSWLDVAGVSLDREAERIVLRLRGRVP